MRRRSVIGVVTVGGVLATGAGVGVSEAVTTASSPAEVATVSTSPRVGVSTVQYDSPGATVPDIVTVYDVPPKSSVTISAAATGGGVVTCVGSVWRNPVRHTASRTCYLGLPVKAGSYRLRGTARLTRGGVTRVYSGTGSRAVVADGKPSLSPMSASMISRIERCSNATQDVWLTFDDGGSPAQVNSILATLKRNNVKGHFFFRGDWSRKYPALMLSLDPPTRLVSMRVDCFDIR